jgi:nucleotide-binding universal stress UspA family protein
MEKEVQGEKSPRRTIKVLVAIDGSEIGDMIIKRSGQFQRSTGCELTIMVVIDNVISHRTIPDNPVARERLKEAEEILKKARVSLESHGVGCTTRVAMGPIAGEIVRIAEEEGFDIIFVGSRGLGGIKRMFLGSVADTVLRQAHCSVMLVR